MSEAWYLYDGVWQEGPLAREVLIDRLKSFGNLENVSVWRAGYEEWKPADQVFGEVRVERVVPDAITVRTSYKARYSLYGLLSGLAICLADYVFQWRGNVFVPWQGSGAANNIGYIAGTCGALVVICFVIGSLRDAAKLKSKHANPLDPSNLDHTPVDAKSARYNNFIARNWRGEYPLGATYWGFGFLGNLAAGLIPILVSAALPTKSGYDPRFVLLTIATVWIGVAAIGIWQTVAVWRSASRHIDARALLGKKSPWAELAKLVVVLGFVRLAGEFLNSGIPQLTEGSRMAFLDDPDIPAYSIRVMRNGTEAEIIGGFKYGLTDDFEKILSASRQVKVVHLDSTGGRIGEAMKLNRLIHDKGLTTYVSSGCHSACTIAFAGGRTRILRQGAKLGFHAPAFPGMSKRELQDAAQDQVKLFLAAGFDRSFVEKALSTPSEDLWKPSVEVLVNAKVITGVSDGSDFAVSGLGSDTTREQMAAGLTKATPILQVMQTKYPEEYAAIVAAYYDAFVAGRTETQAAAAMRGRLNATIVALRPNADDQVLMDFASVVADQYAALNARSPKLCFLYASGNPDEIDFIDLIPKPLLDREKEVSRRIIETARRRPETPAPVLAELWKKLGARLSTSGISAAQFDLLTAANVPTSKYAEYCSTWITLYREVTRFRAVEGAPIMRQLLTDK
jgi:hypothetical protein